MKIVALAAAAASLSTAQAHAMAIEADFRSELDLPDFGSDGARVLQRLPAALPLAGLGIAAFAGLRGRRRA